MTQRLRVLTTFVVAFLAFSRSGSVAMGQSAPFQPPASVSEFGLPDPQSLVATDPRASLQMQAMRADQMHLAAEMPLTQPYNPAPAPFAAAGVSTPVPPNIAMDYGLITRPDIVWNEVPRYRSGNLLQRIWRDHQAFYSADSLVLLGVGLGVGAAVANTQLDTQIQAHLQTSLHQASSDEWLESLHAHKELGDGYYTLPVFAGAWALSAMMPESQFSTNVGTWGERSLRGFLVGAPPVILLQQMTGGSRPGETGHHSRWDPFEDNNGISGHSFMGALPFITAAKMTDRPILKAGFYAASTLAPLSRTADGAHYPSQVALGWWMAYLAASAVHASDDPRARIRILPWVTGNGSGFAMEFRY